MGTWHYPRVQLPRGPQLASRGGEPGGPSVDPWKPRPLRPANRAAFRHARPPETAPPRGGPRPEAAAANFLPVVHCGQSAASPGRR